MTRYSEEPGSSRLVSASVKYTLNSSSLSASFLREKTSNENLPSSPDVTIQLPVTRRSSLYTMVAFILSGVFCWCGSDILNYPTNEEAWHPLPGAPLRFWLRFIATLRLRLWAGSGLSSAGLFCLLSFGSSLHHFWLPSLILRVVTVDAVLRP